MRGVYLDCHDLEKATDSLAAGLGCTPAALRDTARGLHAGDWTREADFDDWVGKAFLERLRPGALEHSFCGAHLFHATRALDPGGYQRLGLLPLVEIRDSLWESLYKLVATEIRPDHWAAFRRDFEKGTGGGDYGQRYRARIRSEFEPYAELVREGFLHPQLHRVDYLQEAEAVLDIARAAAAAFGIDLPARFERASVPCIVKIRLHRFEESWLRTAALPYVWAGMTGDAETDGWRYAPDLGGAIPAADVLNVERISR